MPDLSLHNIDQIVHDVRSQEINFSHLLDDLIDHVCCDVEDEMRRGLNFQEAYSRVRQKMGKRGLKEIQQDTLFAVDTKYRQMKTLMKISGVAGTILMGFSSLFKIQHWPGASILMTLGAITLIFAFLPSALSVLWKETHSTKRVFLFISAFIAGATFITGTLFKINHWPGAGFMLIIGAISGVLLFIPALLVNRLNDPENKAKRPALILGALGVIFYILGLLFKIQHWPMATFLMVVGLITLCIIAFPWYTYLTWKDEGHVSRAFIFMVIGFLLLVVPGALVNLSLQRSYLNGYFPNNQQQNQLYDYLFSTNTRMIGMENDSLNHLSLVQLHSKTIGLLKVVSSVQEKMVRESEGKPGKPAMSEAQISRNEAGSEILYKELSKPFLTINSNDFLIPESGERKGITLATQEYTDFLASLVGKDNIAQFRMLLDPSTYMPDASSGEVTLMSVLHSLEVMKNGILTAEACAIKEISKNK
jgi:hypothetical protein